MAVSRDKKGDIKLDCQDHSISFNRRQINPESEDEQEKYEMVSDEMNTQRNKPCLRSEDMD